MSQATQTTYCPSYYARATYSRAVAMRKRMEQAGMCFPLVESQLQYRFVKSRLTYTFKGLGWKLVHTMRQLGWITGTIPEDVKQFLASSQAAAIVARNNRSMLNAQLPRYAVPLSPRVVVDLQTLPPFVVQAVNHLLLVRVKNTDTRKQAHIPEQELIHAISRASLCDLTEAEIRTKGWLEHIPHVFSLRGWTVTHGSSEYSGYVFVDKPAVLQTMVAVDQAGNLQP